MAVALVGGAFLSSFLNVLFDRMARPEFVDLFRERKNDDKLMKKLKMNLLVIEAVLDDAENKETSNQAVKEWLNELHDIVREADDLVDKINTEALRVKIETEYQSASKQVSGNKFLNEMMPEIGNMVETLDGFIQHITPLGLQSNKLKRQSNRLPSTSLADDITYGRDGDKEKIIEMLLSGDTNPVVSIVGLGGIGKTTLAQLVYKDERVKRHFYTKAWVYVSEEYDVTRITKELLRELGISFSDSGESLNSLQVKLQGGLNGKKFLLVLDDVWNSDYDDWDKLRISFNGGLLGSKIIVTTRDQNIAGMMRDQNVARMMGEEKSIHHLDFLSEEDCWSLFEKHAYCNQNLLLEEIGKKIVKKCGGLPLAVKTVAGLLRSKTMAEEWEDILVSEVWCRTDNQDGILPALRLSYIHLPSHLKRCFAYCAVFPKDYNFTEEEVTRLWLANDLLEHPGDNRLTKGVKCFRELRLRSLFQQSTDNSFTMHDLVNDLARSVSGKCCLRLEDYYPRHGIVARLNHFSYNSSDCDTFDKFELLGEATNLRTFLPLCERYSNKLSNKFLHDMLPSFKSLRVLSLPRYHNIKLPDSFGGWKQLRFLDLSSTDIQKLPEWICTLYNLQTILLSYCMELEELPVDLGKLINLCYLDISSVPLKKMPIQMGRLRNLQVLTAFVIGKDSGSTIKELGKFNKLRGKLLLSGLENVSCGRDASMANMKGKIYLEDLILEWKDDTNGSQVARDVLDCLEPHSSTKHLGINGYCGTRFPDWLGSPSFCHMKSLRLYDCQYCYGLPALGHLPSLESLEIVRMSNISALTVEMYGDSCEIKPFPSLKKFTIERMKELERWDIPEGEVFCNLEELYLIKCSKLDVKLPKQLSSLKILEISGCDKLVLPNGRLSIFNGDISQQFSSLRELNLEISALKNLKELCPAELNLLANLERLEIRNRGGPLLPFRIGGLPTALRTLKCYGCGILVGLPTALRTLKCYGCGILVGSSLSESCHIGSLTELTLMRCDFLEVFSLGSFPMLKHLYISACKRSMEMLSIRPRGSGIQSSIILASLQSLIIHACDDQLSFPEGGLPAPNLIVINLIYCKKLKSLPERMQSLLPSLRSLEIYGCPEIECFPEGGLPSSLSRLCISNCKKLLTNPSQWNLRRLHSLRNLKIGHIDEVAESFPNEDWLLPCTLEFLSLKYLKNLKKLNFLQQLTSLKELEITECPLIKSLPDVGMPASLTTLKIIDCPGLKPRIKWEKGQDWHKVAHILCVIVDSELFP